MQTLQTVPTLLQSTHPINVVEQGIQILEFGKYPVLQAEQVKLPATIKHELQSGSIEEHVTQARVDGF